MQQFEEREDAWIQNHLSDDEEKIDEKNGEIQQLRRIAQNLLEVPCSEIVNVKKNSVYTETRAFTRK